MDFFELKAINDNKQKARQALRRSIKALRVYRSGEQVLLAQVRHDCQAYLKAVRIARKAYKDYFKEVG